MLLKGQICCSADRKNLCTVKDGYLAAEDGICLGVFSELPEQYRDFPLLDFENRLILPGLVDLHLHAPQFSYRGLGMDMELLDWLKVHTFPEEAKFRDRDYAQRAYGDFARHMAGSFTTRACIFASAHTEATEVLMDRMEETGLVSYVGRVNMDRDCPDYLREKDAAASLAETRRWISATAGKYARTKPILTPRFVPSCTDELLRGLGELAREQSLPVQSHLSENFGEIQYVRELCPWSEFYGQVYDRFGLLGGKTPCVMAHCVHSTDAELALMKKNGVFIAHSPESNMNIASGVAPVSRYLDMGLQVGLASDVAGGSSINLFRAMTHAIQASKLRWRLLDQSVAQLTFQEAFYMATMGGGAFFGKVGTFAPGYEMDALVVDDSSLTGILELSIQERLERVAYLGDDRCLTAKFVAGRQVL